MGVQLTDLQQSLHLFRQIHEDKIYIPKGKVMNFFER